MNFKKIFNFGADKKIEDHLIAFLQDEYDVGIVEKYNKFLLVKKGTLVDFFDTSADLRAFLEGNFTPVDRAAAEVTEEEAEAAEDKNEEVEEASKAEETKEENK